MEFKGYEKEKAIKMAAYFIEAMEGQKTWDKYQLFKKDEYSQIDDGDIWLKERGCYSVIDLLSWDMNENDTKKCVINMRSKLEAFFNGKDVAHAETVANKKPIRRKKRSTEFKQFKFQCNGNYETFITDGRDIMAISSYWRFLDMLSEEGLHITGGNPSFTKFFKTFDNHKWYYDHIFFNYMNPYTCSTEFGGEDGEKFRLLDYEDGFIDLKALERKMRTMFFN